MHKKEAEEGSKHVSISVPINWSISLRYCPFFIAIPQGAASVDATLLCRRPEICRYPCG